MKINRACQLNWMVAVGLILLSDHPGVQASGRSEGGAALRRIFNSASEAAGDSKAVARSTPTPAPAATPPRLADPPPARATLSLPAAPASGSVAAGGAVEAAQLQRRQNSLNDAAARQAARERQMLADRKQQAESRQAAQRAESKGQETERQARQRLQPNNSNDSVEAKQIATPRGPAVQENSAAAKEALQEVRSGKTVYKQGAFGDSKTVDVNNSVNAQYWALQNPLRTPNYAKKFGLPNNKVDFIMGGKVPSWSPVVTRKSVPVGKNPGGEIEAVVPEGGMTKLWFHMPDKPK